MGQKEFGIAPSTGAVYERTVGQWIEVWPTPMVSTVVFLEGEQKPPASMPDLSHDMGQEDHLFREDSFDATTRIRRGRFYKWAEWSRQETIGPVRTSLARSSLPSVNLHRFWAVPQRPSAKLVAIGAEDSLWRILNAERISTGEWLVTLKARGGAGLLPEVDDDKIPELGRAEVVKAVDHMVDVAHRETPGSIVDVARNTAALLLAVYAADQETDAEKQRRIMGQDLGDVCKHFRNHAVLKKLEVVTSAGHILARLHPRNKPNEQHQRRLRLVTEDDATFAVSAISLLLNEFRWTQETARVASSVNDAAASL